MGILLCIVASFFNLQLVPINKGKKEKLKSKI